MFYSSDFLLKHIALTWLMYVLGHLWAWKRNTAWDNFLVDVITTSLFCVWIGLLKIHLGKLRIFLVQVSSIKMILKDTQSHRNLSQFTNYFSCCHPSTIILKPKENYEEKFKVVYMNFVINQHISTVSILSGKVDNSF